MDHRIFKNRLFGVVFRLAKAIPIAPNSENLALYEQAMQRAQAVLAAGDILGIFPEGGITRDGQLQPFKGGIMRLLQDAAAQGITPPVIPIAIQNMWGSYFSRVDGAAMSSPLRRGVWSRVGVHIGAAQEAVATTPEQLQASVRQLLDS